MYMSLDMSYCMRPYLNQYEKSEHVIINNEITNFCLQFALDSKQMNLEVLHCCQVNSLKKTDHSKTVR